jgi:hypothetical protein
VVSGGDGKGRTWRSLGLGLGLVWYFGSGLGDGDACTVGSLVRLS